MPLAVTTRWPLLWRSESSASAWFRRCIAIGGALSWAPRYDYFPLDDRPPTYSEDPHSLSQRVMGQQADAFARRYSDLVIASLRVHGLMSDTEQITATAGQFGPAVMRDRWGYTSRQAVTPPCLLVVTLSFSGQEVSYIVVPCPAMATPLLERAHEYGLDLPIRGDRTKHRGSFDCGKAEHVLGWCHEDT